MRVLHAFITSRRPQAGDRVLGCITRLDGGEARLSLDGRWTVVGGRARPANEHGWLAWARSDGKNHSRPAMGVDAVGRENHGWLVMGVGVKKWHHSRQNSSKSNFDMFCRLASNIWSQHSWCVFAYFPNVLSTVNLIFPLHFAASFQ